MTLGGAEGKVLEPEVKKQTMEGRFHPKAFILGGGGGGGGGKGGWAEKSRRAPRQKWVRGGWSLKKFGEKLWKGTPKPGGKEMSQAVTKR